MTLQAYVTLDGFADFPEYPGAGDPPPGEEDPADEMWVKNWASTDTLLLGRQTYEQWADFWPSSKRKPADLPYYHEMSKFADKAQKVVFSNTIKGAPWENTRFVSGDVAEVVAQLRTEPGKNMAVVGGTGLPQQFMRRGLIDDYFFTVFPVILGKGHKLFGDLESQQTLELVGVRHFKHGEVFLHYQTIREGRDGLASGR